MYKRQSLKKEKKTSAETDGGHFQAEKNDVSTNRKKGKQKYSRKTIKTYQEVDKAARKQEAERQNKIPKDSVYTKKTNEEQKAKVKYLSLIHILIDLCVKDIYKKYLYNDPKPENMPTLQDFYERLNFYAPDKPAAQNIANSLQLYVTGSQNVFNHRSNVDTQNRVVCFDIRELGTTLRKAGMLIVQHMVWTRVSQNRSRRKSTRYYVDEFHLLLNQPQTANRCV